MIAYATLTPDSPRRVEWLEVFGTDRIRLECVDPRIAYLPGFDGPRRCYRAALDSLLPSQYDRVRRILIERFYAGRDVGADFALLGGHGLPILDGPDLIVTVEAECYL